MLQNISRIQNIAYKLNSLNQFIDDTMIMTKIMTVLPEEYKHFGSAWNSVSNVNKTMDNLCARLQGEESKLKPDEGEN